ncbi:hypothetical protein LI291_08105 [Intestinibacillus massiliensis]|nr:hypothetical protein [Intestinibacillus massiliensis]
MTDFAAATARLLELAAQDMGEHFTLRRDALVEGRYVALDAAFDLDGERKPFGLIPTGVTTHCHERCLFVPAEKLTAEGLDEALGYITRVHDNLVAPDGSHEFSLFSLVLVTADFDRALLRRLKKFSHDMRHEAPAAGWSAVRVAVVDLSKNAILTNKMGGPLGDRLKPTLRRLK